MNSIDLLKGLYYTYLKPEPCKISEHLGTCLSLLNQHSLWSQVLRLCDLTSSPHQKSAQKIVRKWSDRILELIKAASGSGEDRNRAASLALLAQLISHSTFELMHNNKDKWIDTLSVIVKKETENDTVNGIALVAFANLIVKSSSWDQMRRDVMKDSVYGGFMNALVKSLEERPVEAAGDALKALYLILKANMKSRIPLERLLQVLLTILDKTQKLSGKVGLKIYKEAVRCVPLLVDSGSTWVALVEHIVVTTHHLLERLYVGFDDERALIRHLLPKVLQPDNKSEKLLFFAAWNLTSKQALDVPVSLHRLTVLSHLLQMLLVLPLNYTVDIPVWELLIVVRHLTLLDATRASSSPLDGLSAADVLLAAPVLHQSAHLLLETLIRQLRSRLFPFVAQIADLIAYEMAATRNIVAAPALAASEVQASLHRLVKTAFEVFKTSVVGLSADAARLALEDLQLDAQSGGAFTAQNTESEKTDSTQPKQNPNKKKAAQKALSEPSAHINTEALTAATGATVATSSKTLCLRVSAFECLQSMLTHIAAFLSDDVRASIDKTILGLCLTMSRHRNAPLWRKSQFEPAFAHSAIRLGLYQTLLASSISTGRLQTPVLPYAVQYLTFGQNDSDVHVASTCARALDILNTLLHPRIPLLPPSISLEQRTSLLSTAGILAHQTEQQLLQLHEEKTLMLLQRTQARRSREGDNADMEDDRPTKRPSPYDPSESSRPSATSSTSFLETLNGNRMEASEKADTLTSIATSSERTVLFKSTPKPQETKPAEQKQVTENMMAVDVDIVDDEPDSEDEA